MFIAIGFPKSAREEGAEVLYAGLDKGAMNKACEAAVVSKKFERIGKLLRPLFQEHCLQAPVDSKVDCSPAHNLGLSAERAALAAGVHAAIAAHKGASIKVDGAKAEAIKTASLAEDEAKKFAEQQKASAAAVAAAPMVNAVKQRAQAAVFTAKAKLDKANAEADAAAARAELAVKDLAAKQPAADVAVAAAQEAADKIAEDKAEADEAAALAELERVKNLKRKK